MSQTSPAFLVEIYAGRSSDQTIDEARKAFKEDLKYAGRWMIFIRALGFGAIFVCGKAIAKMVYALFLMIDHIADSNYRIRYQTNGNRNLNLEWLATEIGQYQIVNFRSLCDIFDLPTKDILEWYHVRGRFDKSELLVKIQMVCCQNYYHNDQR